MHPFTLRFSPALEQEFFAEYYARTLGQVRLALVLAVFLYGIFGVLDLYIAPEQRRALWTIRYAIAIPTLIATLAFTYASSFRKYCDASLFVSLLIGSLGIVAMTSIIPPPGSYLYYAGLLLAITYVFTVLFEASRIHFTSVVKSPLMPVSNRAHVL